MDYINSDNNQVLLQNLLTIYVFVYFTSKVALMGTKDKLPLKTNEQELMSFFGGIICFILIYYFTNLQNRELLIPTKNNNIFLLLSFVISFILVRYFVGKKETEDMSLDEVKDNMSDNSVLMGAILCLIAGIIIMNMFFGEGNSNSSNNYLSYFFFVALTFIVLYIFMKSDQQGTVTNLSLSTIVLISSFLTTSDIQSGILSLNSIQIFLMVFFVMLISKFGLKAIIYKNPDSLDINDKKTDVQENTINISSSFLILITIMSVVFFYFTSQSNNNNY